MGSVLADEIRSQPAELAGFLQRQRDRVLALAPTLPPFSFAVIAARGSSDHAATYARYAWGALAGISVVPATPSLHTIYGKPPRLEHALAVGISQSGQSPDVVAVLQAARRQGRPTIAITNDPASPLARVADHVIELGVSPERSIAATKTYTAQLAAVALLGAAFSGDKAYAEELSRIPEVAEKTLVIAAAPAAKAARRLQGGEAMLCLARGLNNATAAEMALKLRELVGFNTQAFSAADFRHGSIAFVTPGTSVGLVMPSGATLADMQSLAHEVRARGGALTVISDDKDAAKWAADLLPIAEPVPEWLSPLVAVLPAQLLAWELATAKGLDPDNPAGLAAKVVRTT